MSTNTHALSRGVHAITTGFPLALEQRRKRLALDQLGELILQFQLAIKGTAAPAIAWDLVELQFDAGFYNATEQRDSPYVVPTFWHGAQLNTPIPVIISAVVMSWTYSPDGDSIIGAKVNIGALNPSRVLAPYEGFVHLTFQGYGAVSEDNNAVDVGT